MIDITRIKQQETDINLNLLWSSLNKTATDLGFFPRDAILNKKINNIKKRPTLPINLFIIVPVHVLMVTQQKASLIAIQTSNHELNLLICNQV